MHQASAGPPPFNTDDVEGTGVTKMFRVCFDRNHYSVPWRLAFPAGDSARAPRKTTLARSASQTKQVAVHPPLLGRRPGHRASVPQAETARPPSCTQPPARCPPALPALWTRRA